MFSVQDKRDPKPMLPIITTEKALTLDPVLNRIRERGYVKCRGVPSDDEQGYGFSYDMVRLSN